MTLLTNYYNELNVIYVSYMHTCRQNSTDVAAEIATIQRFGGL